VILERILTHKRREIVNLKSTIPQARLERALEAQPPALDLGAVLRRPGVSLIAEVKRASPSKGLLCPNLDPAELALAYARGGAGAISVLTDETFFRGGMGDLLKVRRALDEEGYRVPILRKDFILDPYQVVQSRAYGADALLLIAKVLSVAELAELLALCRELGMEPLVEVHDEADLEKALPCAPCIIGINNRDLRTFEVNLETTLQLRSCIPRGILLVSESGIRDPADVTRLTGLVDGVLVGEALVTATDPAAAARALVAAGAMGEAGREGQRWFG